MISKDIIQGAKLIASGDLVVFPTETIYGLGANAFNEKACLRIYAAKGRPSDNPLIVHVSDEKMLNAVARNIPAKARKLMKQFWPGPLTIILEKSDRIPSVVSKLETVAVRMPNHPIALELIKTAGVPIAAPSANKSGKPSPTSAKHVREDFENLFIIDGGEAQHGLESTVVSVYGTPRVLRLGAITVEQLRRIIPEIEVANVTNKNPESPGMKYKHYAPKQPLIVFRDARQLKCYAQSHKGVIILCKNQYVKDFTGIPFVDLGKSNHEVARNLFKALRTKKGKKLLFLAISKRGIGRSIMDRVERAASEIRY